MRNNARQGYGWTHTQQRQCVCLSLCWLTGVKEDHGLEADKLLPLQLEFSHPGCGGYEHVEDFRKALDAAALFPATQIQPLLFPLRDSKVPRITGRRIVERMQSKSSIGVNVTRSHGGPLVQPLLQQNCIKKNFFFFLQLIFLLIVQKIR